MNSSSYEEWESVTRTNVASIFFVTSAFLGLLAKGASDANGLKSSVINITSIWAHSRLSYGVVSIPMNVGLECLIGN